MRNLPHLAARMYGVPLMLLPSVADIFGNTLQQILQQPQGAAAAEPATARKRPHGFASNVRVERYADKPYIVTDDGVGVLGVYGALLQRWAFDMATCESFASYEVLRYQHDQMQADPDVKAILTEWDSPGGEVAGNFELARHIMAQRGGKPMWAIANEGAYSAAYSLAAATDRIIVPQAGSVGSIGVVMVHVDQSVRDQKQGLAYTFIYAGDRKVDFNSHAPLSDKAKSIATAEVVRLYDMFTGHVAAARSLDVQAVRDTEAGVFAANDAKALGLVDTVGSFDDALAELTDLVRQPQGKSFSTGGQAAATTAKGRTTMSDKQAAATDTAAATTPTGVPEAEVAQRVAAAQAEARTGERTRIAAILRAPEAAGRGNLAQALAFDSDMAPEAATKLLGTAAQEQPAGKPAAATTSPLAAAMATVPNPPVGATAGGAAADDSPEALAASAIALARSAQGVK